MTRTFIVLSAAIVAVVAIPQLPRAQAFEPGLRMAQAEPPPKPGEKKPEHPPAQRPPQGATPQQHPPGAPGAPPAQHPPAAAAPPAHPGPAAVTPPAHPAPAAVTPPAHPAPAAATPPAHPAPAIAAPQQPNPPPPAAAQTPTNPPPRPGAPGAPRPPGEPAAVTPAPGQVPAAQAPPPHPAGAAAAIANAPADPHSGPRHLDQLRGERHQIQEGNRTVIQEADRTIIREGGHDIIRHNEADRFRFNAREVNVEHRGNDTVTIALRPDGSRIITEVDATGRLLRRVRRDPEGREVIIIDNSFEPRGPGFAGYFVDLPPPAVRIPRELYIRDTAGATAEDIYLTLMAPPVERIERRYGLDEIRYSEPLRLRMPRVDIDTVNFESGSWEITPDQIERLAFVAQGITRALQRNPREVFLIEGYTDAVGNDVDNLSLSDRRAESVAVVLTNQFGIPPENLTTQGYGKQFLKVPTDGPERANRRVAARRITPLLMGQN